MLILENLYLGAVNPSESSFKRNSQYAKALDEVVKAGDALTESLTEKQKELFPNVLSVLQICGGVNKGRAGYRTVRPVPWEVG